jgi:hypothetical protein
MLAALAAQLILTLSNGLQYGEIVDLQAYADSCLDVP